MDLPLRNPQSELQVIYYDYDYDEDAGYQFELLG